MAASGKSGTPGRSGSWLLVLAAGLVVVGVAIKLGLVSAQVEGGNAAVSWTNLALCSALLFLLVQAVLVGSSIQARSESESRGWLVKFGLVVAVLVLSVAVRPLGFLAGGPSFVLAMAYLVWDSARGRDRSE